VASERVNQLEERCGARLLERTTRNVRLTPAGERALDAAAEIDAALARLDERVAGMHVALHVAATGPEEE
jgi:DNA-binding transcriptional LysR family regulator